MTHALAVQERNTKSAAALINKDIKTPVTLQGFLLAKKLFDKHGITIAEESVLFLHGNLIYSEYILSVIQR